MRLLSTSLIFSLALFVFASAALATVRPPDEWFDEDPARWEEWLKIAPELDRLEFADRDEFLVPSDEIYSVVTRNYEATSLEEIETPVVERSFYHYDRNLDGRLDYLDILELGYDLPDGRKPSAAPSYGTAKWIVLRSDFPDNNADPSYDVAYFEERYFSYGTAPKPSCNDYFREVSFDKFEVSGTIDDNGTADGWYRANNNKSYYHSGPGSGWGLVYETILKADPYVDYSDFDVDGDGYVDTLIVFYPNAVFGGGLHPHRSSGLNIKADGVIVDAYFLSGYNTSDDSWTMTISSHEYGHILGLPDLYDTDGSSRGIAKWGLMAYQYDTAQKVPSPSAWSRISLGWIDPAVIDENYTSYSLPDIHNAGDVLKVWTNGQEGEEYFLVANRLKVGTDSTRPGEGLMIWHIDDSMGGGNSDNRNELQKHVDVESARGQDGNGRDPLDNKVDNGHANDPFFSGNSASAYTGAFSASSNPTSDDYDGNGTSVIIDEISGIADPATFDVYVLTGNQPSVTITSPSAGAAVSGTTTFSATALPSIGRTIGRIDFYADGWLVGSDSSDPYSIGWITENTYNGSTAIKAVAWDSEGEAGVAKRSVTVSNAGISVPYLDTITTSLKWAIWDGGGTGKWKLDSTDYNSPDYSMSIGTGYDYNENDYLRSVRLDLTGMTHPIARFKHKYGVSLGENFVTVFVTNDDGTTLDDLASFNGYKMSDWQSTSVDLLDYAGDEVYLLFMLNSTALSRSSTGGWWIDDFAVKELSDPPSISGVDPPDLSTLSGLTTVTVSASDDEGVDRVEFYVRGDLVRTDTSSPYTFDFPTWWMFNGDEDFSVSVFDGDDQETSLDLTYTFDNTVSSVPFEDDFEAGIEKWYVLDQGGLGYWHTVSNIKFSGANSFFSGIGTSGHDNNEHDLAFSPSVDLSGSTFPWLSFANYVRLEPNYDYAYVYIYTDFDSATLLGSYDQLDSTWAIESFDLSAFDNESEVKINFLMTSDGGLTYQGWWVDYLSVVEMPVITGTSPGNSKATRNEVFTLIGNNFGAIADTSYIEIPIASGTKTVMSGDCETWTGTEVSVMIPDDAVPGTLTLFTRGLGAELPDFTPVLPPPDVTGLEQY